MFSQWAYLKSSDPDKMGTRDIVVHIFTNVFAGSDTTAIALRAIVYLLCHNPRCMNEVVQDIQTADQAGKLNTIISCKESTPQLPYFHAVPTESMRLHPSVGLRTERHLLPSGTIVDINPWVTNHNPEMFPEPNKFLPERWLRTSEAELKRMDAVWN